MHRLKQWWKTRSDFRRNHQEELDTLEVFWSQSFRNNLRLRRERNPSYGMNGLSDDQIFNLCNTDLAHTLTFREKKEENRKNLTSQVCGLIDYVASTKGINPYPDPIFKSSQKTLTEALREKDDQLVQEYYRKKMIDRDVEAYQPGEPILHPDGFSLQIRKSRVDHPESGYGVWVEGSIIPGTVIAIYPGVVYLLNKITKEVVLDNDYMINRYDDCIVDGRHWERRVHSNLQELSHLSYAKGDDPQYGQIYNKYRNFFAIGNYINHPPKDKEPNVMSHALDFLIDLDDKYKHYIPNYYAHQPGLLDIPSECYMKSVVIVAKRQIHDEELFLNYRFNPKNPYPDWYHQPNEEEARRRWSRRSLLF